MSIKSFILLFPVALFFSLSWVMPSFGNNKQNLDPLFVGINKMKSIMKRGVPGAGIGVDRFKQLADNNAWGEFGPRYNHYDWWVFPSNVMSRFKGKYWVFEYEIEELSKDKEYMTNLRLAARLVLKSWGYDVDHAKMIDNPLPGQKWRKFPIRLYKMIYSLHVFKQYDLLRNLRPFIKHLDKNTPFKIDRFVNKRMIRFMKDMVFSENEEFRKVRIDDNGIIPEYDLRTVELTPLSSKTASTFDHLKETDRSVRVLAMSDTHNLLHLLPSRMVGRSENFPADEFEDLNKAEQMDRAVKMLPTVDLMLLAGDFTNWGGLAELDLFLTYLGKIIDQDKAKEIVFIAGNHEFTLDPDRLNRSAKLPPKVTVEAAEEIALNSKVTKESFLASLPGHVHYLEDSSITLFGLKIYGTPWVRHCHFGAFCSPFFQKWNMAQRKYTNDFLAAKWKMIPRDTNILLTHMPPAGINPNPNPNIYFNGCLHLRDKIEELTQLKVHLYGHVHEAYGVTAQKKMLLEEERIFINGAMKNEEGNELNAPIYFTVEGGRNFGGDSDPKEGSHYFDKIKDTFYSLKGK